MTTSTPEEATEPPKQANDEVNAKKRPMTDDNDADKMAARREANRIHALKSRQRSKALLLELQRTVTQLSGEKAELERENAVMRAQIEVLQQQNLALTQSQRMLLMRSGQLGGATGAAMNAFAPGLFGLSQAASMPAAAAPGATSSAGNGTLAGTPTTGEQQHHLHHQQQQSSMDQAAVAAAAAAMIQGQAAAAAAAAGGFQQPFQQFMSGFGMGGISMPAGAAPAPANHAPSTPASTPLPCPTTPATTPAPPALEAPPTTPPQAAPATTTPQAPPTTTLPSSPEFGMGSVDHEAATHPQALHHEQEAILQGM